jgi:hypothetical protein
MVNNTDLNRLLQLSAVKNGPEFIVYSSKLSPRLNYVCKFIFEHVMNCKWSTTDNKQVFKNSGAYKISYSTHSEKEIINISPHDLLYKTGVDQNYRPNGTVRNGFLYFHNSDASCDLGYDIFSSVFYFIARYEEWQTYTRDEHGRFELAQSVLGKEKQQLNPLVNTWIEDLKKALLRFYPDIKFPKKRFQYISSVDVDNLYAYKYKSPFRVLGASGKDIITFKLNNLIRRFRVLRGNEKDPFDVYDELNALSKAKNIPLVYFFLQRTGTEHDRSVDPNSPGFKEVFEKMNKAGVDYGLHPSYDSLKDDRLLKEELDLIKNNSGKQIRMSRQHYLRFDIKTTPKQLISHGIKADFSMGFASGAGYRAGTFTPFNYYDLQNETETELLMVPFVVMDGVYFIYSNAGATEAEKQMLFLAEEAKKLDGIFISVFHERSFDDKLYPGFGDVYRSLQNKLS